MKNRNQMKSLLILLSVVLSACMLVSGAMAAAHMEATGACTNPTTEGVEFLVPFNASLGEVDKWRTNLTAVLLKSDGTSAGTVSSLELEMANSSTRYQCTEVYPDSGKEFSCNSLPINASITGVYFRVKPTVTEDTDVRFWVYPTLGNPTLADAQANGKVLMEAWGIMKYPPYPCARNYLVTKDFVAPDGDQLVYNTSKNPACTDHQWVSFLESPDKFAMVNIIPGDKLAGDRVKVSVNPDLDFEYYLNLYFSEDPDNFDTKGVIVDGNISKLNTAKDSVIYYHYKPGSLPVITGSWLDGKENSDLPLYLMGGLVWGVKATGKDLWGNDLFPTSVDMDIKLWYENKEGTLGYENSIFHFNRKLNFQFAPYCTAAQSDTPTGLASELYDLCDSTRQLFTADLTGGDPAKGVKIDKAKVDAFYKNTYYDTYTEPANLVSYWVGVRKCVDASCASTTTTQAYPYSLTVSDGSHLSKTYGNTGTIYHKPGTASIFNMKVYGHEDTDPLKNRPFQITGIRLAVDEPGTYVVYPFMMENTWKKEVIPDAEAAGKFYVTVPTNDSLTFCSTLANNGYFKALWNDCMDPGLTQLMPFEHIQGKEEAWVRNSSGLGIHFPYVSEWSYVPQELEVASLTCKFEALSAAGRPGDGYCHPTDVYVPPYTKVTITGGTLYLSSSPKYDDYKVAYARRDTWNISHLFFSIQVKECENAKIPDTGISLRSPLKVNESVDAATSYVFTGNSLRIPAIGLGMETPIPIVHVYYNEGSSDRGWDLSTLGNYVGELEGGTYLPYAGNSALTGHYYSMGVFKNLEGLNMGDEIIVYGNDGVKYIYKVVQKFITQPTDVYEMFQQVGERSLTLVTCENYNIVTDEYERRTIVRATIDSQDLYEEGIW